MSRTEDKGLRHLMCLKPKMLKANWEKKPRDQAQFLRETEKTEVKENLVGKPVGHTC